MLTDLKQVNLFLTVVDVAAAAAVVTIVVFVVVMMTA